MKNLIIGKYLLVECVERKIRKLKVYRHILSIIDILFEEMVNDLLEGKEIKINNFGTLQLKELKSRPYFDVLQQAVINSEPHKILRFNVAKEIKKKLCDSIDIDKTFYDD